MDRVQFFLSGLPLFLFVSDLFSLFAPPPPPPPHHHQQAKPQITPATLYTITKIQRCWRNRLWQISTSALLALTAIGIIMGGEHMLPMIGMTPPPWYYSLRANRFGSMASAWLLGNVLQSFLQSSGAFEVYFNDELVFSKLEEGRFPDDMELKNIVSKQLAASRVTDNIGWS